MLYWTCYYGVYKLSQLLLNHGVDVNAYGGRYGSALHAAIARKHDAIIQLLIDKGADVHCYREYEENNNSTRGSYSPLQMAAFSGNEAAVKVLLAKGAQVNARGGRFGSALPAATYRPTSITIPLLLLDAGAEPNALGDCDGSALRNACSLTFEGTFELIQLLVERRADINLQPGKNGSALYGAASTCNVPAIQFLLERGCKWDLNEKVEELHGTKTMLEAAISCSTWDGDEEAVKVLLDAGADVEVSGDIFEVVFQNLHRFDRRRVIRWLIDYGADLSAHGGRALRAAILNGLDSTYLEAMLRAGANVNAHEAEYGTPLQILARAGFDTAIQQLYNKRWHNEYNRKYPGAREISAWELTKANVFLLLANGADIDAQSAPDGTALQAAASRGHEAMVRLLIEQGADMNVQSMQYGNALQSAASSGSEAIVQLLLERGACDLNARSQKYGTAPQAAASKGHEAMVQLLIEQGADINVHSMQYGNALQSAASSGSEAIVQLLLKKDATDINARSQNYGTALQAAVSSGSRVVVELLLSKGADANVDSEKYNIALLTALWKDEMAVARLLLQLGADVNAKGGKYDTSLHVAVFARNEEMVEMLLSHAAERNARDRHGWTPLQCDNNTACRVLQPIDCSENSTCSENGYRPQFMINATEYLDYTMDEKGMVTIASNTSQCNVH